MRIVVEQLNGETFQLEVTAEMTMRALKGQVKSMHTWEDELSRETTAVELIIGDKKVTNEETVEELGLCDGSKVTVVFRKNVVQCLDKSGFGPDLHPEALAIVEIPGSETEIEDEAFADCQRLARVIIPSSVTQIGNRAFQNCGALTEVTIPDSVTQIGREAFAECRSLPSVNIPNSITHIGAAAFGVCPSLVTVNIPDSVTRIGDAAFASCISLTQIDIPDSVVYVGPVTFASCKQLTLTAPARLLGPQVRHVFKMVAKECGCGRCDWRWFRKGWLCPAHAGN